MIYTKTPRLILRSWQQNDLHPFIMMNKDPRVMEHFPAILEPNQTIQFYNRIQKQFADQGFGLFAVETKHNNQFIGFVGLNTVTFNADFTPCTEISWRLSADNWGQGYATEAAKACLEYATMKTQITEIYSFTTKSNLRSQALMERLGMKRLKEFAHPLLATSHPLSLHVLYIYPIRPTI